MKVPNAGQSGRLPKSIEDQSQLRDAPISLAQLKGIVEHIEGRLTKETPQESQYIQLHIRQIRGILEEVAAIQMKLDAAISALNPNK